MYTVQYWGVKDLASLRKILGIDYVMWLALTIPVVLLAFFASPVLMGLFTDDPEVIALGGDYMHIACFSYIFIRWRQNQGNFYLSGRICIKAL